MYQEVWTCFSHPRPPPSPHLAKEAIHEIVCVCVCDLLNVLNKKPVLKHKGHVQKNNYPLSPLYLVQLWNWQMMNNSRFLNQRLQQYITNTSVEAIINGKWSIPYKKKQKKHLFAVDLIECSEHYKLSLKNWSMLQHIFSFPPFWSAWHC